MLCGRMLRPLQAHGASRRFPVPGVLQTGWNRVSPHPQSRPHAARRKVVARAPAAPSGVRAPVRVGMAQNQAACSDQDDAEAFAASERVTVPGSWARGSSSLSGPAPLQPPSSHLSSRASLSDSERPDQRPVSRLSPASASGGTRSTIFLRRPDLRVLKPCKCLV